ncbi:MAG: imidazolonepropionase [Woeseiaceae bacterium]|nr:imidazolonepropionase [Woeseiaceae bacterium]
MPAFDLLLADVDVATMVDGRYSVIADAGVGIIDGQIAWVGAMSDLPANDVASRISLPGQWLTPALIDCHTHLVFAGNRSAEFEQRLGGASYEDIARAGGGIMSTVNATREARRDTLIEQTRRRLVILRSEGCGTVEIKSGYGLNVDVECRMLDVARTLGVESGLSVINTFLGAHAVPTEFRNRSDDYVDLVCNEMMPAIAAQNLADAVDAYCEPIAFSPDQVRRVFDCAATLNLPVKLHADQLSDSGGAALAAEFNALSADHVEYTNQPGVEALAAAGTVAVLLPGAFLTLGETQLPPLGALRANGVPVAVATDCNPGTSPVCSIRTAMALASSVFRLTPEECLAGVTCNAARALGLADRGTIEVGKRADLAIWEIGHPQELSYWLGSNELTALYVAGQRL